MFSETLATDIVRFAPVASALLFLISIAVTIFSLSVAFRSFRASRVMHIYAKTMDHNKVIYDDAAKQIAINIFHGLEDDGMRATRTTVEATPDGYQKLYWAARAVHLNHIILFAQIWVLCGQNERRMRKHFPGWVAFAERVAKELDPDRLQRSKKPDWYRNACQNIDINDNDIVFGREFKLFLVRLRDK